jgi:plastocyanin
MARVKISSYAIVGAAALAAALGVPAVASASTTIEIQDTNSYDPASATLDLGDGSFDWEWGPDGSGTLEPHNVVQGEVFDASGGALFDSGESVTRDPDGFSVTASAGGYPYYCAIHLGMEGDVNVRPVVGRSDGGQGPIPVMWATPTTTTGDSYDVRFRTGKKWKKWKNDTSKPGGTFGKRKKPVKVKSGRSYRFQVRSRSGKKTRSEWSPELVVDR